MSNAAKLFTIEHHMWDMDNRYFKVEVFQHGKGWGWHIPETGECSKHADFVDSDIARQWAENYLHHRSLVGSTEYQPPATLDAEAR